MREYGRMPLLCGRGATPGKGERARSDRGCQGRHTRHLAPLTPKVGTLPSDESDKASRANQYGKCCGSTLERIRSNGWSILVPALPSVIGCAARNLIPCSA